MVFVGLAMQPRFWSRSKAIKGFFASHAQQGAYHICFHMLRVVITPCRAQADAEARRVADRAALLAARRATNRAALKPEPAAGTPATTALRVRLPDGSNHLHRFSSSAVLQVSAAPVRPSIGALVWA